jgi:hypothetical protein
MRFLILPVKSALQSVSDALTDEKRTQSSRLKPAQITHDTNAGTRALSLIWNNRQNPEFFSCNQVFYGAIFRYSIAPCVSNYGEVPNQKSEIRSFN